MTAPKRFTVGQEVVIDPRNGRQQAAVVTKVGRKYVTVEDSTVNWDRTREFDMTTSRLRDATYTGGQIYTTDEWEEERLDRAERKRTERHRDFLISRANRLPRADLSRLNDLLDELNPPEGLPS